MANKYINGEPTDFSNARIPDLQTLDPTDNSPSTIVNNVDKAKVLAETFLPPPTLPIIPITAYPEPLLARGTFTRNDIHNTIKKFKPNTAPGPDGIKNLVLQQCVDTIINHLYYIFCAILKLNSYPTHWLNILAIVLHKPGKPAYNIAKAYHPIGQLNILGKLFSTLVAMDISYLTEKY